MSENIYSEKMTGGVEQLEEEKIHYRPTETKEKKCFWKWDDFSDAAVTGSFPSNEPVSHWKMEVCH